MNKCLECGNDTKNEKFCCRKCYYLYPKSKSMRLKISNFSKGKRAWNKNLTKKNDKRVAKYSQSLKGKLKKPKHINKIIETKRLNGTYERVGKILREKHKGKHFSPNTEFKKGNSPHNIGKTKETYEPLMRTSKKLSGINSRTYIDGRSYKRNKYPTEFNNTLQNQIRERDNYCCQLCFRTKKENKNRKLSIHHIYYNKKNNDERNLITLCTSCHSKTNFKRKYWREILNEKNR